MFCNTIKESNCFKGSGKCLDLMLASSKSFSKYLRIVETGLSESNLTLRLFASCFKQPLKILNQDAINWNCKKCSNDGSLGELPKLEVTEDFSVLKYKLPLSLRHPY